MAAKLDLIDDALYRGINADGRQDEEEVDYNVDDFDDELFSHVDDIDDSEYVRELLLSKLLEIVDAAVNEVLVHKDAVSCLVIKLLLKGIKKVDIAKSLGIAISMVYSIESKFCSEVAMILSKRLNRECTYEMIIEFVKQIKVYRSMVNRKWEQWMASRRDVDEKIRLNIDRVLSKEIAKKTNK